MCLCWGCSSVGSLPSMHGALVQSLATCKLGTVALTGNKGVSLELLWLKWDDTLNPACPSTLPSISLLMIKLNDHL